VLYRTIGFCADEVEGLGDARGEGNYPPGLLLYRNVPSREVRDGYRIVWFGLRTLTFQGA